MSTPTIIDVKTVGSVQRSTCFSTRRGILGRCVAMRQIERTVHFVEWKAWAHFHMVTLATHPLLRQDCPLRHRQNHHRRYLSRAPTRVPYHPPFAPTAGWVPSLRMANSCVITGHSVSTAGIAKT